MNFGKKTLLAVTVAAALTPSVSQAKASHIALGTATGFIVGSSIRSQPDSVGQLAELCKVKVKAGLSLEADEQKLCDAAIETTSEYLNARKQFMLIFTAGLVGFFALVMLVLRFF